MTLLRSQVRSLIEQYGIPMVLEAVKEAVANVGEKENVIIAYGDEVAKLKHNSNLRS